MLELSKCMNARYPEDGTFFEGVLAEVGAGQYHAGPLQ